MNAQPNLRRSFLLRRLLAASLCLAAPAAGCRGRLWRLPIEERIISNVSYIEESAPVSEEDRTAYWIVIPRPSDPPAIDGDLSDHCWKKAARVGDFILARGRVSDFVTSLGPEASITLKQNANSDYLPAQSTEVRICADHRALYFAIRCTDSQIITKSTSPSEIPEMDDCVEIIIDTQADLYRIVVNSQAKRFEEHIVSNRGPVEPGRWHPSITSHATVSKDEWRCELAVPFSSLEARPPATGQFFDFNVGRRDQLPLKISGHVLERISTWSPVNSHITELDSLGKMFFRKFPDVVIVSLDPGFCGIGYNLASVLLRNQTRISEEVRLLLSTFDDDDRMLETVSRQVLLRPREERVEKLNYFIPRNLKSCYLSAVLIAGEDERDREIISYEQALLSPPTALMQVKIEGTEYRPGGQPVVVRVDTAIGENSLPDYKVVFSISDSSGEKAKDEIVGLKARSFEVSLAPAKLKPGVYKLAVELVKDQAPEDSVSSSLVILAGPTGTRPKQRSRR